MSQADELLPEGERMRRALLWVSDQMREHPERTRERILHEAEVRFDLTPRECTFLERRLDGESC